MSTPTMPAKPAAARPTVPGEFRLVFRGVSYEIYKGLADATPETSAVRLAFDGKDLEIMTINRRHERTKGDFGRFVEIVTIELGIPCEDAGQTTWAREDVERALEADESYYFDPAKIQAVLEADAAGSKDANDPIPDLAIEVDISPSRIDRSGIYAALGVSEVWRFDGKTVVIEQLGADGKYAVSESSRFLPIHVEEIRRWVVDEKKATPQMTERTKRLRAWVRAELFPRHRAQ